MKRMFGRWRVGIGTALSVPWVDHDGWRPLVVQVFDMPATGPTVRRRGEVWLESVTGTPGWPFTADDFGGWVTRLRELGELVGDPHQRGLLLGDLPVASGLQDRFGVRPNVFAVRFGPASFVMVNRFDRPSDREVVSRLLTASELMVG